MKITGIVGTAKNTGKTTTLAALIGTAGAHVERIGVTGIGYDGEEIDTITGLPKPRLLLQAGTVVCTSERCLMNTTAGYVLLKTTKRETALGPIVIVEITSPGMMVLAGPNTKRLLHECILEMDALGIKRLFVDGSLNRIAAMSAVETIIFSTGASRSTEIGFLAEEARAICSLFTAPASFRDAKPETVTMFDADGAVIARLDTGSLFDAEDADAAASIVTRACRSIVIPELAALSALERLVDHLSRSHADARSIILADPTILLLAGEPIATVRTVEHARECGIAFGYLHPIRVAAMTVNPFYPRPVDHTFTPAYVDKDELLTSVRDAVAIPVFNIRNEGAADALYALL